MLGDRAILRLVIAACCLCAVPAVGQNGGQVTNAHIDGGEVANSRGRSSAEVLRAYGIELSEPSLVAALSNPNARIRMNAAMQLAADNDSSAIPSIEGALSSEKDPMTRVAIAGALASLGDQKGSASLQAMCADSDTPIRAVIYAVQMLQMLDQSRAECTGNILNAINNPRDRDYRDVTITLLAPMYNQVPREEANRIVNTIQKLLSDRAQQPSVRLAAGQALAEIGSPSSVAVVRSAIEREEDPTVRSSLQADLAKLSGKP
jgi:hypothetical protein